MDFLVTLLKDTQSYSGKRLARRIWAPACGPHSTRSAAYDRPQKPGINIEKLDRPVASGRGRAHPGPVREEKEGGAGPDLDQEAVVEGLDLALCPRGSCVRVD